MTSQGERSTFLRFLVNFLVATSLIIGFIYFWKFKDYFLAVVYILIAPLLLLLPRWLYQKLWHRKYNFLLLNILEAFAILIFISASAGSLGLYDQKFEYDSFVHFFILALICIALVFLLEYFLPSANQKELFKLCLCIFVLTVSLGILWELFEFGSDKIIKTQLFFDRWQDTFEDTIVDIIFDTFGAFVGSLFVYFKWPTWQKEFRIKE